MCRSIKPLFKNDSLVLEEDVHAAALQFVRKVSGMRKPSQKNTPVFDQATSDIQNIVSALLKSLSSSPKKL